MSRERTCRCGWKTSAGWLAMRIFRKARVSIFMVELLVLSVRL